MKQVHENNRPQVSQREITKKYCELLKAVAEDEFYTKINLLNRVNVYTCDLGHQFKTIDIHAGVTPFMHRCDKCSNMAKSSFYNDIRPDLKPVGEWFRPSLAECFKLRKKEGMLEHIFNGGLEYRKIKTV